MSSALDIIIFIVQVLIGIVLLYGFYRIYKFYRSYVFDKRFGPYSVELLEDDSDSLFDNISYWYKGIRNKLSKVLIKSKLLIDYSKKYEKYSTKSRVTSIDLMNYISTKIFIGLLGVLLLLFSSVFKYINLDLYLILFVFLVGFFILDVYLMIMDKIKISN